MKTPMIDGSRIESMLATIRAAQAHATGAVSGVQAPKGSQGAESVAKPGFADALKASLDQVNSTDEAADRAEQQFALGDDKVSLSDVMISMQKSSIAFQATIQVRNRLVSAYNDIMNMPM